MNSDQLTILLILVATVGFFLWGRLRHDVVAMAALLLCVLTGAVPGREAFAGFGHPAVITVASVLVLMLGHGLQVTGVVQVLAKRLLPENATSPHSCLQPSRRPVLLAASAVMQAIRPVG